MTKATREGTITLCRGMVWVLKMFPSGPVAGGGDFKRGFYSNCSCCVLGSIPEFFGSRWGRGGEDSVAGRCKAKKISLFTARGGVGCRAKLRLTDALPPEKKNPSRSREGYLQNPPLSGAVRTQER